MSDWSAVLAETRDLNATFYGSWSDVMGRQQQNENNKNATNVKTGPNTTADFNQIGLVPTNDRFAKFSEHTVATCKIIVQHTTFVYTHSRALQHFLPCRGGNLSKFVVISAIFLYYNGNNGLHTDR